MLIIGLVSTNDNQYQKHCKVIFFGTETHIKKLDNKTVRYLDTPLERKDKILEYFLMRKCNGSTTLETSPKVDAEVKHPN